MNTRTFDRDDVVACYQRLLGREPENEDVILQRLGGTRELWGMIQDFLGSEEYRLRAGLSQVHSTLRSFSPNYLAKGLSQATRSGCAAYHYGCLQKTLVPDRFVALLREGLAILDDFEAYPELRIDLLPFIPPTNEGEISLTLTSAGKRLALLSFTLVPAAEFGCPGKTAIFISRLQGATGVAEDVREVTRRLGDISPPYLLMCVLEGMAQAQGIDRIIGINALAQPSYQETYAASFRRSYDTLFASLGATRGPRCFHIIALPREARPLSSLPIAHRARTRRKRAQKEVFTQAAGARWRSYLRSATS